jgi:poly-gamma-glutamate synthesis protein (capsule biosynthesis protein)
MREEIQVRALRFVAVGDCIVARRLREHKDPAFTGLVGLIRQADVAFGNFELVTPRPPVVPSSENGMPNLMAPEWVIDELAWMGFNLFNVANNHSGDYMYTGFVDTLKAFEDRELSYAGGGRCLGEARSPGYLETGVGRAALVGAAANFSAGSQAAHSRPDMPGRPGLSHLRVLRDFVVDAEGMAALRRIDSLLGTAAVTERRRKAGILRQEPKPDALQLLGLDFYEGERFEFRQRPHPGDLDEICKWIADAKGQADFVVASLHCHHGTNGDGNNFEMAEFLPAVARRMIDAGADVFACHGPHLLRPVEVYKGKPVFYSLGNFVFELEGIVRFPHEMYQLYGLGPDSTPSDFNAVRERNAAGEPIGFVASDAFYQTVLPICEFADGQLTRMDLHPVTLGRTAPRSQRGVPKLADPEEGRAILEFVHQVSAPFGVSVAIEQGGGRIVGRCSW